MLDDLFGDLEAASLHLSGYPAYLHVHHHWTALCHQGSSESPWYRKVTWRFFYLNWRIFGFFWRQVLKISLFKTQTHSTITKIKVWEFFSVLRLIFLLFVCLGFLYKLFHRHCHREDHDQYNLQEFYTEPNAVHKLVYLHGCELSDFLPFTSSFLKTTSALTR